MKKHLITIIFIFISIASNLAQAWSYTGHVIIAQIAYNNLNTTAKNKATQLANVIFNRLPQEQKNDLDSKYPTASTFAKIAMLPDVWRKWKLETILNKYDAPTPTNLISDEEQVTANWHFINLPYPATQNCQTKKSYNVVWAIEQVQTGLTTTQNTNTQAVMMVLLEHYIGDIHQPLHHTK